MNDDMGSLGSDQTEVSVRSSPVSTNGQIFAWLRLTKDKKT